MSKGLGSRVPSSSKEEGGEEGSREGRGVICLNKDFFYFFFPNGVSFAPSVTRLDHTLCDYNSGDSDTLSTFKSFTDWLV